MKSVKYLGLYIVAEAENPENQDSHLFVYRSNTTQVRPNVNESTSLPLYGIVKDIHLLKFKLNKKYFFVTDHLRERLIAS